ncbi:DUF3606 domain-containing protein [Methylobacterium sp. 77]|uniref:DUF3606 domain-containing protein n=1 Tax=Methylobacterium sp. 77 TaxID=1101192 RepID=UPI00037EDFF3|nr:DUF3606 domain-containing protein [Methylobacterium sp. 77]
MSAQDSTPEALVTVTLTEPRDKAYWARYFQTPSEEVEAAVAEVGHDPAKVAERLGKSWPFEGSGIV